MLRERKRIAQVDVEEIEVEASFWDLTMVCVVLGANPPFSVFEGFIKIVWGKLGIERVARMNAGYTIVKFRDEATQDMVLESGVVHFDRKPVILRPWSKDLDTMSTIGKPMMIDKVTKERSMVKFVRVLVDVEISDQLPQSISFLNERGQLVEQTIEFECCKRDQGAVWRKKKVKTGLVNTKVVSKQTNSGPVFEILPKESTNIVAGNDTQTIMLKEQLYYRSVKWGSQSRVITLSMFPMEGCNILSWNVRGLNKRNKQRSLLDFCRINKIGLGDFLETKLRGNKIEDMMKIVFVSWDCFSGPAIEGRTLLVWKVDYVYVTVLQENEQFVHCHVKIMGKPQDFCLTFVYGRNKVEERKCLWHSFSLLVFLVQPWLLAGDFNVVFDYDDRLGGRSVTELEMEDDRQWRACGVVDELRTTGSHYTWSNKQMEGARIFSKLDRVFKNEAWVDASPNTVALINWDVIFEH
ncbi:uncharacterized protein LOC133825450 [Humulus lupulus]|uniref:uncharacterized protein LOC133825450 n=1 Tax=Humulus lupulus TaxID=3486 RepID=UPI002B406287|nr:uncharacterized protein LOC133825450 [Humulus lupulus]